MIVMKKPLLALLATIILILGVSAILIFQAKGYRFDIKSKKIEKTGIIAVSSVPVGAAVYVNNHLSGATNTNIVNLTPGEYALKVVKEGYLSWEKNIPVVAEMVTPVEITLFPSVPDLRPLTFTGITNPLLSPDGQKIVYALKNGGKSGLWVLDLSDRPLNFSRDPKQIVRDLGSLSFSNSS